MEAVFLKNIELYHRRHMSYLGNKFHINQKLIFIIGFNGKLYATAIYIRIGIII